MQPSKLQVDTLTVDSFETEPQHLGFVLDDPNFLVGNGMECTGCVSGCGIFPQFPE
ncbi:MAG: hypothetical protein JWM27_4065 [Gemmatimonadetes bacterium]|nr:hypothetical protein [Gemmatimonadota bacterium]